MTFVEYAASAAKMNGHNTAQAVVCATAIVDYVRNHGVTYAAAPWDAPDRVVEKTLRQEKRRLRREMRAEVYRTLNLPGWVLQFAVKLLPFMFPQYAVLIRVANWVVDWAIDRFIARPNEWAAMCRVGAVLKGGAA